MGVADVIDEPGHHGGKGLGVERGCRCVVKVAVDLGSLLLLTTLGLHPGGREPIHFLSPRLRGGDEAYGEDDEQSFGLRGCALLQPGHPLTISTERGWFGVIVRQRGI
jgi:hypothetical protein